MKEQQRLMKQQEREQKQHEREVRTQQMMEVSIYTGTVLTKGCRQFYLRPNFVIFLLSDVLFGKV